ncbi:MAG: hypothetical protein Q9186_004316 [Xanthomendoza sp. 1 TL-2023]
MDVDKPPKDSAMEAGQSTTEAAPPPSSPTFQPSTFTKDEWNQVMEYLGFSHHSFWELTPAEKLSELLQLGNKAMAEKAKARLTQDMVVEITEDMQGWKENKQSLKEWYEKEDTYESKGKRDKWDFVEPYYFVTADPHGVPTQALPHIWEDPELYELIYDNITRPGEA